MTKLTAEDLTCIALDDGPDDVADEVTSFAVPYVAGRQTQYDVWFGSMLEWLSDGNFTPFSGKGAKANVTRDQMKGDFEEAVLKAVDEATEWFQDDPDDYKEANDGKDPNEEHPWSNETVDRCRLFFVTGTAYMVWKFCQGVRQAALDALDENIVSMAFLGEDIDRVGIATDRATDLALRALMDELDARVAEMGKDFIP